MRHSTVLLTVSVLVAGSMLPDMASAQTETLSVIAGGQNVGHLKADTQGGRTLIDYDVKNNGRGPTLREAITISAEGIPTEWTISGTTTFGSKVDERYRLSGNRAEWTDSLGRGSTTVKELSLYIPQETSGWGLGLYARTLLKSASTQMLALPSGTLRLEKGETLTMTGKPIPIQVTAYTLSGVDLHPDYLLLDAAGTLFANITPTVVMVREGYEGEEKRLRALATKMSTDRYVAIQNEVAHRYDAPLRIRNVRVFDPAMKTSSQPLTIVVRGKEIAGVQPVDTPPTPGEVTIEGDNGTIVPGMYEMHAHLGQDSALLNLAAGVTSVRDMGNNNEVLDVLAAKIEDGTLAGPRVVRSGFIEGKSPFNANTGIVVDSEAKALEAVRWYGARGFWQIKVYNSINPAWVPAMVKEAHTLGMRVAGHVPAFSDANTVIEQGYDEVTHINQFMLGWVLEAGEDTRTLLRVTALKRMPDLDLKSERVQHTVNLMVERKVAIDPTLAIHEEATQNRDGLLPPGAADYLDHMPIGYQRSAKKAMVDASAPYDDQAYRGAFEKIVATVKMLNDRGVFIVPGTDLGGSFKYHRELELYQRAGMTAADILARATLEMARYLGQDQRLGSIEKGKLADFFLVPGDPMKDLKAIKRISMVVKDGIVYFPSEIYPKFGIAPFVNAPSVTR